VLACAPSVVGVTHEAPRGGPLLDFGTEPASQEGVTRLFYWSSPDLGEPHRGQCPTCLTFNHV